MIPSVVRVRSTRPRGAAENGPQIQGKLDAGRLDPHVKLGFRVAGDLELVHDHRTEQRGFDFPELDPQAFLPRGACDPEAQAARDEQRSQDDGENAGEKHRAA